MGRHWIAAVLVIVLGGALASGENTADMKKIDLRVLYAGHAGSQREADFAGFLKQYFTSVETVDLARFTGRESNFDVAIVDYDGNQFQNSAVTPPPFSFSPGYSRPTITCGVFGALLCEQTGLKTGYE